jgi:hypothetical protein
MVRIHDVEPLAGFTVRLHFTDGTVKEVDLRPYLHGPVFEPLLNDRQLFRSVSVDRELGTIVWENGADIDPDVLYSGLKPAWMEQESLR